MRWLMLRNECKVDQCVDLSFNEESELETALQLCFCEMCLFLNRETVETLTRGQRASKATSWCWG